MTGWRRLALHGALVGMVFQALLGLFMSGVVPRNATAGTLSVTEFVQICSPDGLRLVPISDPGKQGGEPGGAAGDSCPVCLALGCVPLGANSEAVFSPQRVSEGEAISATDLAGLPGPRQTRNRSRAPPLQS